MASGAKVAAVKVIIRWDETASPPTIDLAGGPQIQGAYNVSIAGDDGRLLGDAFGETLDDACGGAWGGATFLRDPDWCKEAEVASTSGSRRGSLLRR